MERLTIPDEHIDGGIRRTIIDAREVRKHAMTIYWQLKKYEDTGISPAQLQVIEEECSKMAKELAELRQQNRWVPVSERLPDYNEEVLITNGKYVTIDTRYFLENTEDGEAYTWDINGWDDVIAWMPLPEPYKE